MTTTTPGPAGTATADPWRNRIVGEGEEAPDQLLANPRNARIHPDAQQRALAGLLDEVGYVQRIIVNRRTGYVVDGHARVGLALRHNQPTIPVVYVDLDDREEALVVAALDPIAAMAEYDRAQLRALLDDVHTGEAAIAAMLDDVATRAGVVPGVDGAEAAPDPLDGVDLSDRYRSQYGVVVVCGSEDEQREVYDELVAAGRTCRVVVT